MEFLRGGEAFGHRNEIRMNFIPPNVVNILDNFTDGTFAINFDADGGLWIDYRPQYSTVTQSVATSIKFFRESNDKEVQFEQRDYNNNNNGNNYRQQQPRPFHNGLYTPPPTPPTSIPSTPGSVGGQAIPPQYLRKKVKVIEKHIVLTTHQLERFLGFSEVISKIRQDYRTKKSNSSSSASAPIEIH